MKSIYKLSILCLFVTLAFACSSNEENAEEQGGGTTASGVITAKVDGKIFKSMEIASTALVTNGVLAVQGSDASGTYIRFNIMSYKGKGTYKSGTAINNANSMMYGTISPVAAWTSTFNIGSGTLTIEEETSSRIKGTFSFEGYNGKTDKKIISEGKFDVKKQ